MDESTIAASSDDTLTPTKTWPATLRVAAATGVLVGLAEVAWAYRYPDLNPTWRASLPGSFTGLLQFSAIAIAVDMIIMLLVGLVCMGLTALGRLIWGSSKPPGPKDPTARRLVGSAGVVYLAAAWFVLFLYPAALRSSAAYLLRLGATVAGAAVVGFLVVWVLDTLGRRVHRRLSLAGWLALVAILLVSTLPPYSRNGGTPALATAPPESEQGPRPNIVLVTIDTLRYDHVGCSGEIPWIKTPTLDALAGDGAQFLQAISQSPTTTPSHCSIMTSVYPNVHDAVNGKPMRRDLLTVAHCLSENGYATAAFTSATTTRSINSGLDGGFDLYVDSLVPWSEAFSADAFQNLVAFYILGIMQKSQIAGEVVTERALRWLAKEPQQPFFLWLHYFDPHSPYGSPPPYRDMYLAHVLPDAPMASDRARYAGDVTYTDAQLGRVIEALKQRQLYDDALLVVTSDHGEAFGEQHWGYTEKAHGDHLYDTTQHVPLIIKAPGAPAHRRIQQQVELIDIAPTILACTTIPPPPSFAGQSLWELVQGQPFSGERRPAYAMTWVEAWDPSQPQALGQYVAKLARRTPQWKYIMVDRFFQQELYNLQIDPLEITNISEQYERMCARNREDVSAAMPLDYDPAEDPRGRLAPALRRSLEALGYLGGAEDDPTPGEKGAVP